MEITWFGHSCFRLTERNYATVVTDPFDHKAVGYDALKLKAEIVTISHDAPGHNNSDAVKGTTHVITGAGEFEIGEVFITAVQTGVTGSKKNKDRVRNTLYVFDYDGITVAHLGDMQEIPPQSEVEALGTVNVLSFQLVAEALLMLPKLPKLSACWNQIWSSRCTIPHLMQN